MSNETLTANLSGIIQDIQAETYMKLNQTCGILDTVRTKDSEGQKGKTVDFPAYANVGSSDVSQVAEGTDHETNKQVSNAATSATVDEHVIMGFISDLSVMSADRDVVKDLSTMFANAIKAKLEADVVALFSEFNDSNDLGGSGVDMSVDDWFEAKQLIKAQNGDVRDMFAILSPKQYWGTKGIRSLIVDADADSGGIGEEMKAKGFVANFAGTDILISNEIDETAGDGSDAAGGIYTRGAIGVHTKGLANIEAERNASKRGFELVCTGRWKEVELEDNWGCYLLTNV